LLYEASQLHRSLPDGAHGVINRRTYTVYRQLQSSTTLNYLSLLQLDSVIRLEDELKTRNLPFKYLDANRTATVIFRRDICNATVDN